jgi:hypothetical protein
MVLTHGFVTVGRVAGGDGCRWGKMCGSIACWLRYRYLMHEGVYMLKCAVYIIG